VYQLFDVRRFKKDTSDRSRKQHPPAIVHTACGSEYLMEKIVAREKQGNRWMYRVRWTRYEDKDDTWQPLTDLDACKETVEEFHRERRVYRPRDGQGGVGTGRFGYGDSFCLRGLYFFTNSLELVLVFREGGSVARLGFFPDCRINWRAHVKHRLALGYHRFRTMARIMTANGIRRKLASKVRWAVAMSTAAYGVEAIWKGVTIWRSRRPG
jgi:hypothetical protein